MIFRGDPIGPNWAHPLNLGLRGWWLAPPDAAGTIWYDLAGFNHGTLVSGSTSTGWRGSQQRFGRLQLDGTAAYVSVPVAAGVASTRVFTWSAWIQNTGTPAASSMFVHEGNSGATAQLFQLKYDTTPTSAATTIRSDASVLATVPGSASIVDKLWHHVVATGDGTTLTLYVDGVVTGTPVSLASVGTMTINQVSFGVSRTTTSTAFYNGSLDDIRSYPRCLLAAEVAALYREGLAGNPDALTWRPGRSFVLMKPPPAAYSLAASVGSFALAGQAAALKAARVLTASAGAFAETGQSASLFRGSRIVATTGAFAETGGAAGLIATRILTASAGSFAEAGQAAALKFGHRVAASAGSFALTGNAATLTRTTAGAFTLAASAGSFVESGQAAALYRGSRLTAASGSFAETGRTAGLLVGHRVTAAAGSFVESGQAAGLRTTRRITASAGSHAISGRPAGLLTSRVLAAAPGSYALTGLAAGLTTSAAVAAIPVFPDPFGARVSAPLDPFGARARNLGT